MNHKQTPKLIVMVGLQGSGKSAIAYEVSKKLAIPVFSVDPIHSAILAAGIKESFEAGLADYLVAKKLAKENLQNGISIIIDACNYVKKAQDMWTELAARCNSTLKVIECQVEEAVHKDRIQKRVRNIYGMAEVTWQDVKKRKEESTAWEVPKLLLDTSYDLAYSVEKAIEYIMQK